RTAAGGVVEGVDASGHAVAALYVGEVVGRTGHVEPEPLAQRYAEHVQRAAPDLGGGVRAQRGRLQLGERRRLFGTDGVLVAEAAGERLQLDAGRGHGLGQELQVAVAREPQGDRQGHVEVLDVVPGGGGGDQG